MKFEQALKAMRRGEIVKRKSRGVNNCLRLVGGQFLDKALGWKVNGYQWDDSCILADDWVIVRKKKRSAERNVFADPRAGDVVKCVKNGGGTWSDGALFFFPVGEVLTVAAVTDRFVVLENDTGSDVAYRGGFTSNWLPKYFSVVSRAS